MSTHLWSIEIQRQASGASPEQLRQRMIESDDSDDAMTDDEIMEALEAMDDATRWAALQLLPDAVIARLYGEMNND